MTTLTNCKVMEITRWVDSIVLKPDKNVPEELARNLTERDQFGDGQLWYIENINLFSSKA